MPGWLILAGGAEFGGAMADVDRRALELAGGLDAPIAILPTAAAPDHNHQRAGANGRTWFHTLGARQVEVIPVIDGPSAADPQLVEKIRHARLIYMLGGFPGYLADTLRGSPAWGAALEACAGGAVLGGSSAGAMVMCEHLYDPHQQSLLPGLNLLPNTCLLPHHNTFGRHWAPRLQALLPSVTLVGIDERTGLLAEAPGSGGWTVYGQGAVHRYYQGVMEVYGPGESLSLGL